MPGRLNLPALRDRGAHTEAGHCRGSSVVKPKVEIFRKFISNLGTVIA